MAQDEAKPTGPDLSQGIPLDQLADGKMLVGHVGAEDVLLVRRGNDIFAVGAHCTHYHGPLVDGLVVGDTVRCAWHHACFDLRTGEALEAPALSPIACWLVEQRDGNIWVSEKREQRQPKPRGKITGSAPEKIVIVGGGAAGFAAAEMLRREHYQDSIVMLSSDDALPYDRPNLSKDYLAGSAPFDYVPLRQESFYLENNIGKRARDKRFRLIDIRAHEVALIGGDKVPYDRLLLATGAEPLARPSSNTPSPARRVVVIGASFIGLEVTAALRARELGVRIVAPEEQPMERILGPQMGEFVRSLHEEHGVHFHLEKTVTAIDGKWVKLKGGNTLDADLVVVGIGVRPASSLPRRQVSKPNAGLSWISTSRRVNLTSTQPATSHVGPIRIVVRIIRVEHWVVAERQGQAAALNMLGFGAPFTAEPFFWSQHYDVAINYVGHAEEVGRNRDRR